MTIPVPLKWRRRTLAVRLWHVGDPRTPYAEIASTLVAGPFGIVRGSRYGLDSRCFTLYHLPSQAALFTLSKQAICKEAAARLAGLDLAWESGVPDEVTGPDFGRAAEVHRRWRAEELR